MHGCGQQCVAARVSYDCGAWVAMVSRALLRTSDVRAADSYTAKPRSPPQLCHDAAAGTCLALFDTRGALPGCSPNNHLIFYDSLPPAMSRCGCWAWAQTSPRLCARASG